MKAILVGVSLSLAATGAHAQYIDWGAAQIPSQVAKNQADAAQAAEAMREQRAAAQQAAAEYEQQRAEAASRADRATRVGSLMASGDCTGAKNLALSEGDFDMAQRVVALCTPKAAVAPGTP
jgi:hypothetical protein